MVFFSYLTSHCRRKLEANRAVLSMPGDGRSGMSICMVLHGMKAACKYVEVLLAFAGYQQHSLGDLTVVLHRQECIQNQNLFLTAQSTQI